MTFRLSALIVALLLLFPGLTMEVKAADFPAFHPSYPPPPEWNGTPFELIQDYPLEFPKEQTFPWKKIVLPDQPFVYANKLLSYSLEGNLNETGVWSPENNSVRRWYHAPWMHARCSGREFTHGLTRERSSRPYELHPEQDKWQENWAISLYNEYGGWTLGQVWADPTNPQASKATFPEGTVAVKLLFTSATIDQVPFLRDGITLRAHIYPDFGRNPCRISIKDRPRKLRELHLLQLDIAVRDSQASNTGWVFTTFMYDGHVPSPDKWKRLVPVGVSWGNDPNISEGMNRSGAFENTALKENILNSALLTEPEGNGAFITHAGLGGRLNGPVDNPVSSCMSCHGRAASPATGRLLAPDANLVQDVSTADLDEYFVNVPWGATTFEENGTRYTRLDYSLQLAFGLAAFFECKAQQGESEGCGMTKTTAALGGAKERQKKGVDEGVQVIPMSTITRGDDSER